MLGPSCLFSMGMCLGRNAKYTYIIEADIALEGVVFCATELQKAGCLN